MGGYVMWVGIGPNLTLCVFVNPLHLITEAETHWIVSLPILTIFLRILFLFPKYWNYRWLLCGCGDLNSN